MSSPVREFSSLATLGPTTVPMVPSSVVPRAKMKVRDLQPVLSVTSLESDEPGMLVSRTGGLAVHLVYIPPDKPPRALDESAVAVEVAEAAVVEAELGEEAILSV